MRVRFAPSPDRRPAHRRRAHGALQLADGPRQRRDARAAHRGHRPRALDARERRADPRRAALAGARLRRGPDQPGQPHRPPPGGPASSCSTAATPTAPTRPADDVKAYKARARRRPRLSAASDEGEGAVRLRVPDEGATVVHDLIRGDTTFQHVHLDDPVIARADGSRRSTTSPSRSTTSTPRSPTSSAARTTSPTRPSSCSSSRRSAPSRRCTRTCRCCTARTARSSPSATARRRCRSCATPATCPRPCATTSRCWAGAPPTTRRSSRPSELVDAVRHRARAAQPGALRRAEAALAQRPLPARAVARRADRSAWRQFTGRTRPAAPAVAISHEKIQTLADFWPLAGFIFDGPPTTRRRARSGWTPTAAARWPTRARRSAARRALGRRARSRSRCASVVEARHAKPKDVFQPIRVALAGTTVSPGIFETLARARAATSRLHASTQRSRAEA